MKGSWRGGTTPPPPLPLPLPTLRMTPPALLLAGFVLILLFSFLRRKLQRRIKTFTKLGKRVVVITGCDSGFGQGLVAAATEAGKRRLRDARAGG